MNQASAGYLAAMADLLYNDALDADKAGCQDMCTANLELVMQIQIKITEEMMHDAED